MTPGRLFSNVSFLLPALAATASAQPLQLPCQGNTGPDVVIGLMPDVANYTASNGLDAISIGTTLCNIGSAPLQFMSSTNQHPVYGGSLYRYRVVAGAGRFEEIGMSWLQHGFFPLQQALCCTCTPPAVQTQLGIGCADPETANRNGSQAGLGPRWQVDATTGAFAYPPQNPPWSGTTARRLEFDLLDVDLSAGVRYFGESRIVAADDAAAGNADNDCSHRELVASGGPTNFTFAWTGSVAALEPAIRRWQLLEPGVTSSDVHVAGDGLFVVASMATNVGGGRWHYEFAVYNHDSDRNAGAFTVPLPAGTTVSNIGFHDVAYRNGDGPGNVSITGTDWPAVVGASSISWACETPAQNPRANAVRWSTTYNFRFDADAAPGIGRATIGLWKPGSPADFAAAAQVPGGIGGAGLFMCAGDGTGTSCPCGNESPVGADAGCLNSFGQGSTLVATGSASVSADTLFLDGAAMPATSTCLYFQGTLPTNAGAGAAFGDGLRCASGVVIRLGAETNSGGASQFPSAGDPSIHVRGNDAAGDVRYYQVWYRNTAPFCAPAGFNLTNGWMATWVP